VNFSFATKDQDHVSPNQRVVWSHSLSVRGVTRRHVVHELQRVVFARACRAEADRMEADVESKHERDRASSSGRNA